VHDLVVGCPVRSREWILPDWFDYIEKAVAELNATPTYVFVLSFDDEPTAQCILQETAKRRREVVLVPADEQHGPDVRAWNEERYHHMVYLRNRLLGSVRTINPDLFWSVDSDMLVHPESLVYAIDALQRFDAVGSRTYLSEGEDTRCPNWANYTRMGGLQRQDMPNACFEVGVIMAIKLMTPPAFNVDYEWNHQGEDIGWSLAARKAGLKLGWDSHTVSKHVFYPEDLHKVDIRCGY
jgi:hypothetical protein